MKRIARALSIFLLTLFGLIHVAQAQWIVLDPANLTENIASALYELQAVENQITQLQNEEIGRASCRERV